MPSDANKYEANVVTPIAVVLEAGETQTEAINIYGTTIVGLIVPTGMDNTEISFSVSVDGVNFYELRDENNTVIGIIIDASAAAYSIDPPNLYPWRFVKLVVDLAESEDKNFTVSLGAI